MLVNSQLFDPTEDKYYSIVLMRLDARKTVLSHFIYGLIRKLTGYLIMALPVCLIAKVNFFIYLALVIATIIASAPKEEELPDYTTSNFYSTTSNEEPYKISEVERPEEEQEQFGKYYVKADIYSAQYIEDNALR